MKRKLLISLFVLVVVLLGYEGCKRIQGLDQDFKAQLDVLHKYNDSLQAEIAKDDVLIDSLNLVDEKLQDKLEHQKAKVIKVVQYVDSSKAAIDNYSEHQLITSFNKRYPADTVTNPLPLAQPVLVSAAKDLVELDGAKEVIEIKDSVIALQQERISTKDTIIGTYASKEQKYLKVISNKDLEIKTWNTQYNKLELENKKLKFKSKFFRIASYAVVGGLTFLMLSK